MPCPFFLPHQVAVLLSGPVPARAPLHQIHEGVCVSDGAERTPIPAVLEQYCNFGYGRHRCEWFPPQAETDAVRFSYRDGQLIYVREANYFPISSGRSDDAEGCVQRQAEAFVREYPGPSDRNE